MNLSDLPLVFFGSVMAVCLWLALVFLVLASRKRNHWLRRFGLMLVTLNGALLWTTTTIMRITNNVDPVLINNWSRVFYAMFAFYVLGFAWLAWRPLLGQSDSFD